MSNYDRRPPPAYEQIRALEDMVSELEEKLKGTVTTEYHDQIVQEAVTRAAKAEQKLERLMAGIKALESSDE